MRVRPKQVRGQEADGARHREDDDQPGRPIELLDGRPQLTDPQHVEQDVQHAAVQVDRGEQRPPPAERARPPSRSRPSANSASMLGDSTSKTPRGCSAAAGSKTQARHVEGDARHRDRHPRSSATPEQRAQRPREAPHAGIPPAAHQAGRRVGVGQPTARRTENGAGRLTKHRPRRPALAGRPAPARSGCGSARPAMCRDRSAGR